MLECLTFTLRPCPASYRQSERVVCPHGGVLLHIAEPAVSPRGLFLRTLEVGDLYVARDMPLRAIYGVPLQFKADPQQLVTLEIEATEPLATTHRVRLLTRHCGGDPFDPIRCY